MNLKFFQKLEKFISYTIQSTGFAGTLMERHHLGGICHNVVQASRLFFKKE